MKCELLPAPQGQHLMFQQHQSSHHDDIHHHHHHHHHHLYNHERYQRHEQDQHDLLNQYQQHYLTLEDIRSTRNSCWLCGCNWLEDHVSLDCPECDGYALTRPCPSCDGKCEQTWIRNISATHDRHKALWVGQCKLKLSNDEH